jgi:hypothetical protein
MTKTPETYQEALDRVFLMGAGDSGTWDLSDNDVAALAMVLKRLDELERAIMFLGRKLHLSHGAMGDLDTYRIEFQVGPLMLFLREHPAGEVLLKAVDAAIQSGQLRRAPTEEGGVVYTDDKPLRED